MSSLGNRIGGLCRWHGVRLDLGREWFDQALADVRAQVLGSDSVRWTRYSSRQRRHLEARGASLTLALSGDLRRIWPLLVAGECCHVGSHATLGQGRYDLFV